MHPDVSVHAKLLTGGLLPLCTTLASNSIYDAFLGAEKRDALLHGHSYTAHAVGCEVAKKSLEMLTGMEARQAWKAFQEDAAGPPHEAHQAPAVWSMWSAAFVDRTSRCADVESVIALGSVLAIRLRDENSGKSSLPHRSTGTARLTAFREGYNSGAAAGLQEKLARGDGGFGIHSRVLGNVLYLMTSQTTEVEVVRAVERLVLSSL